MKGKLLFVSALLFLATALPAFATYETVSLAPYANDSLQNRVTTYPVGNVILGGVPFYIPQGNNMWYAENISGANPKVLRIDINRYGVTTVQTLLNTAWGRAGYPPLCWVEFYGTGGAYYRKDLIGNVDIRDWWQSPWTNNINGTTTTEVFLAPPAYVQRLDKQEIALPAAFAGQTLQYIQFTDIGEKYVQRLTVEGLTLDVNPVPEPGSFVTLFSGLMAAAVLRRVRRN